MSEKFPIKLGKTKTAAIAVKSDEPTGEYYPSLYLEWDKPYDLPESGTMVVRYKTTNTSEDKKRGKFTVNLDVTEILSAKADKEAKKESTEDRLDKLRSEVESEDENAGESY